jgi:outer membrane protein TolC
MIMLSKCLKFLFSLLMLLTLFSNGISQNKKISLQEAIDASINHNPLTGQYSIYDKNTNAVLESIRKQNYPLITWNTQVSVQSENIKLDFPIPNIEPISLPLYKAQSTLETNYLLYDGRISNALIKNEKIKNNIGKQSTTVQLFQLKNQIAELYYSVLLLEKQDQIVNSTIQYFNSRKKMLQSMFENGTILKSDVDKLEIELIKLDQNKSVISNKRSILISALSDLTGLDFKNADFEDSKAIFTSEYWDKRPELQLFAFRKDILDAGQELIGLKNKPKLALFAKAGVGYPNPFNFFDENIAPFAIGGVNLSWNIWDWKRNSIEKQKLKIEKENIDNQKAVFDENMKIETNKIKLEIEGLKKNLEYDLEIIKNQQVILYTTENQYKNGIVTINAFLEEVNKKNIAEFNAATHETEIKKAEWKYKILLND